MSKQWRCFHCDQLFRSEKQAQIHFGDPLDSVPACKLSQAEGHLIGYIRRLESELSEYRNESHVLILAAYSESMEARQLARIAEERGYDKGVSDTWKITRMEKGPVDSHSVGQDYREQKP